MITIEISGVHSATTLREIEALLGSNKLYHKGSVSSWYADYADRAAADLKVVNLNLIPSVRARICGG